MNARMGNGLFRGMTTLFVLLLLIAPGLAKEEKAIKRRQATIKGLAVMILENGKFSGVAGGVTAALRDGGGDAAIVDESEIGPDMKEALLDAERYVRERHPDAPHGIEIKFETEGPKAGRSAGAAFAVLLRSLAEGYEIDPVCITGDIKTTGKIEQIGGVAAKLRGGGSNGATIAIIPVDNTTAVGDLLVMADRAIVLASIQIFSATDVDQAAAIARTDKPARLKKAMELYSEIQALLAKRGIVTLRSPAIQKKLREVLELAPNHLSAEYALAMAKHRGPTSLTRTGSIIEIFAAADPVERALAAMGDKSLRATCPPQMTRKSKKELLALKRITHPEVEKLRKSYYDMIDVVEKLANAKKAPIASDFRIIQRRREKFMYELDQLGTNQELIAKIMSEGY